MLSVISVSEILNCTNGGLRMIMVLEDVILYMGNISVHLEWASTITMIQHEFIRPAKSKRIFLPGPDNMGHIVNEMWIDVLIVNKHSLQRFTYHSACFETPEHKTLSQTNVFMRVICECLLLYKFSTLIWSHFRIALRSSNIKQISTIIEPPF